MVHLLTVIPSWLVSMVVHAAVFIILALWPLYKEIPLLPTEVKSVELEIEEDDPPAEEDEQIEEEDPEEQPQEIFAEELPETEIDLEIKPEAPLDPTLDSHFSEPEGAPPLLDEDSLGDVQADLNLNPSNGASLDAGLGGRGGLKGRLLIIGGGNKDSETAVKRALAWLAKHQRPDGGWTFDLTGCNCNGQCTHAGTFKNSQVAATSMALLPFLGAGQTHRAGKYKKQVGAGLDFLVKQMKTYEGQPGSFYEKEGRGMYPHGMATIVLCEAYAMTHDRRLRKPAQDAVQFIAWAQDPARGGWKYVPRVGSDTSVVGWQLMALKSAHMASGLTVPNKTVSEITRFLDSVQLNGGAEYGYEDKKRVSGRNRESCTPIGLLCRMYLGWKQDHPGLKKGVELLSKQGPNKNMYRCYYATQVMHHFGGPMWKKWNKVMRDNLIASQITKGHMSGSWYDKSSDHEQGRAGRLYFTSLCCMTLEVYYRHLPIYQRQQAEFVLE